MTCRPAEFAGSTATLRTAIVVAMFAVPGALLAQNAEPNPAEDYVRRAQLALASRQSVQADIYELVQLTPPFHMTGRYASAGLRSRLNYTVKLNSGATGSLLEVCDGERLWSVTELPGAKRVTRRDVRQILAAVESAKVRPEQSASIDLALGGLPALLASLQRSMQFDAVKEETIDGRAFTVVQARWKPQFVKQIGGTEEGTLPPHIPDLARIYFLSETTFPERLLYLKKMDDKKAYRPLLDLQFRNVVLDAPLADKLFEFTPPDGVEPEDVTRDYLEQLLPRESSNSQTPPGGAAK